MTGINEQSVDLRVSDADRNGTLRRLHNAVALGLIDIAEFEERSAMVSRARLHSDLDALVGDLPGPGAIVTTATDRSSCAACSGRSSARANGRSRPGSRWSVGWVRLSWT